MFVPEMFLQLVLKSAHGFYHKGMYVLIIDGRPYVISVVNGSPGH
jgi:hypothetical protein